jgi:hypothetical protein
LLSEPMTDIVPPAAMVKGGAVEATILTAIGRP